MRRKRGRPVIVASLLLLLVGCDDTSKGGETTTEQSSATTPGGGVDERDTLSDAEIAGVLGTINENEITQAKSALARLEMHSVRELAEQLVADHESADRRQRALYERLSIRPKGSALSAQLTSSAEQALAAVAAADELDVDVLYIQEQMRAHEALLTVVDDTLIPSVEDPDLMLELLSTRDAVNGHLNHARRLFDALVGKG